MKKIIILIMLLCLCGCQTEIKSKEQKALDALKETVYGHDNKKLETAMSLEEAKAKISDFNSMYDKIEYYGIVKYAFLSSENDYYAFWVMNGDTSYYILLDVYNSAMTFVTAEQLGIKN